jgi:hypothetical protein
MPGRFVITRVTYDVISRIDKPVDSEVVDPLRAEFEIFAEDTMRTV